MSVDVVAVDFNPTIWAVFCELCASYIGEPTQEDELVDRMFFVHSVN